MVRKYVSEQRTSTESGPFKKILGGWFWPDFSQSRPYKNKDSNQYKSGSVKAYRKRKGLTSA